MKLQKLTSQLLTLESKIMEVLIFLVLVFAFFILICKFVDFGLKFIKNAQNKEDEKRKKQS